MTLGGIAAGSNAAPNEAVADLYLRHAIEAENRNAPEDALELVRRAREFAPYSADALYFQSRLLERGFGRSGIAAALAGEALEADARGPGRLRLFPRSELVVHLAGLWHKTRRYADLVGLGEAEAVLLGTDPRFARFVVLAHFAEGEQDRAEGLLAAALARDPDDPGLREARLRIRGVVESSDSRWWSAHRRRGADSLSYLLAYAERTSVADEVPALLREYRAAGGTDPAADAVEAVALRRLGRNADVVEASFVTSRGLFRLELARRIDEAAGPEGSAAVRNAYAALTGTVSFDSDGDGYADQRFVLAEGRMERWMVDEYQDGDADLVVGFEGGVPTTVELVEAKLKLDFGAYPYLSRATKEDNGVTVFHFLPESTRIPILASDLPSDALVRPPKMVRLAEFEMALTRGAVYRIDERLPDGRTRSTRLESGNPTFHEEGVRDRGRVTRRVFYQGGLPVRGERDLDGDGGFETGEGYRNGRIAWISFDGNRNRNPEFVETYLHPLRRSWDLDDDGRIDLEEHNLGRGRVERRFNAQVEDFFSSSTFDPRAYWELLELK